MSTRIFKTMHWILQTNLYNESGWNDLVRFLERLSLPYSVHEIVPLVWELVPEPHPETRNVICFGSYAMRHIARRNGWIPGVYELEGCDFPCQAQHWGPHMLNAGSCVVPFKDVNFTDQAFVRPVKDNKVFSGRVFDWKDFRQWQALVCDRGVDDTSTLTPDTLVQVSEPRTIYAEYRFWVVDGKIVTKSLYKRGNKPVNSPDVDSRLNDFVQDRIEEWQPHKAFVIDVCEVQEGIKLVELNTLNSAGFYSANVGKLVLALENANRQE